MKTQKTRNRRLKHNVLIPTIGDGFGVIYSLSDPESGEIRYVGKSVDPLGRYLAHIGEAERSLRTSKPRSSHKINWINKLLRIGLFPKMELLDLLREDELDDAEIFWIHQMMSWGFDLTNTCLNSIGTSASEWTEIYSRPGMRELVGTACKNLWAEKDSIHRSKTTMDKRVEALKLAWADPNSGYHTDACYEKKGASTKLAWSNPNGRLRSRECTELRSAACRNSWKNPSAKHHKRKTPIFSENPYTGEIRYYPSLAEAGRVIGVHPSKILENINCIGSRGKKMKNFHPDGPFCFYRANGPSTHPFIESGLGGKE